MLITCIEKRSRNPCKNVNPKISEIKEQKDSKGDISSIPKEEKRKVKRRQKRNKKRACNNYESHIIIGNKYF